MMDLRRLALVVVTMALTVVGEFGRCSFGNVVTFDVKHKFAGKGKNLSAVKAHDIRRRGRLLSTVDVDLPLGGNGDPSETGLYFAKIGLGNPSKDYYVQVDTGSDILWVNCGGCDKCPTKSDLGIQLTLYDPRSSSTSSLVYCDQDFCTSTYDGPLPGCKPYLQCQYNVVYGDGSSTAGYFVKDTIHLQQVTGNLQTGSTNGTVIFGCGAKQSGELGSSSEALDGILGFGQANSSMISQLAAAGKVKRMFAHCLDNIDGGGIFAIGEVVSPKVNTTPMVPNHVDDAFPVVKFHFEDSLILTVYPHEYLFQIREDAWCFGWQNSGMQSKDGKDMILLGDLVLSNKLVVYDIENQTIGWTEYNCSSSIRVKDENSGTVYSVGAHDIASASSLTIEGILTFLSILIALLHSSIA
ncbi:Eukaryotic aspartyl protease family protein, putative isoform 2 [Theobroma cacao]|uniref:Eukaryotic aspartyl protease family protein, putative isoform 2 n=1 Tax=Theobroma cacao TaxID=3641 RepID=A0A061F5J2_THECC|nr:Eukaryotic aspartyl protease family protein, putative isoform 2 [Theobroma cacao]